GSEGGAAPVELAQAGVELGRHDGLQDEVRDADREVEAGEPGNRQGEERRRLGERAVASELAETARGALELVTGVDDDGHRRALAELLLVEIADVEASDGHRAAEVAKDGGNRLRVALSGVRLRAQDHDPHAASTLPQTGGYMARCVAAGSI